MDERPRLLVISPVYPWPPIAGGRQRIYHILKGLRSRYHVTLVSLVDRNTNVMPEGERPDFADELVPVWGAQNRLAQITRLLLNLPRWITGLPVQFIVKRSGQLRRVLRELLAMQRFDCIQIEFIQGMQYLDVVARGSGAPAVLVAHDVSYVSQQRKADVATGIPGWFWRREARLVRRYEERGWRRFSRIITMSDVDRNTILDTVADARVDVVPNGVDVRAILPRDEAPDPRLVFVGWMRHMPNTDAVQWFIQHIWPIIAAEHDSVRFLVAGKGLPGPLQERIRRDPRMEYLGYVEDIGSFVGEAWISVVPLRIGSGTRLKILESMALGTPVVTTTIGCEGISAAHEKEVRIADDPGAFARNVLQLLGDREQRHAMAVAARRLVEQDYGWHTSAEKACMAIASAVEERHGVDDGHG